MIYQDKPNTCISQQINFTRKLDKGDGATMFPIAEKQQKTILNISLDSLIVTEKYKPWNIKKVLNLLNEARDSKFVTRKWNIVDDQSNANYDVENEIIYNTEVLRSNL